MSLNRFRGLRPGKGMPAMKLAAWKDDVGGELGVFKQFLVGDVCPQKKQTMTLQ